jgi:hypothetical protein
VHRRACLLLQSRSARSLYPFHSPPAASRSITFSLGSSAFCLQSTPEGSGWRAECWRAAGRGLWGHAGARKFRWESVWTAAGVAVHARPLGSLTLVRSPALGALGGSCWHVHVLTSHSPATVDTRPEGHQCCVVDQRGRSCPAHSSERALLSSLPCCCQTEHCRLAPRRPCRLRALKWCRTLTCYACFPPSWTRAVASFFEREGSGPAEPQARNTVEAPLRSSLPQQLPSSQLKAKPSTSSMQRTTTTKATAAEGEAADEVSCQRQQPCFLQASALSKAMPLPDVSRQQP